ncbi:MAG: DUF4358 domain-containing protein [Bacilli bacterium]
MNRNWLKSIVLAVFAFTLVIAPLQTFAKSTDVKKIIAVLEKDKAYGQHQKFDLTNSKDADVFGVSGSYISYGVYKKPMMIVHASEYAVIVAKKGKEKQVKKAILKHVDALKEQWGSYLPNQFELVNKYKLVEKNGVFVLIIGENASKHEKAIKKLM